MIIVAQALLLCLLQDPSVDDLIRLLESDSVQEREEAQRKLKARGRQAIPPLEKASRRDDPEIAGRAKRLISLVLLAEKENLTPEILADLPGLDEHLLSRGPEYWLQTFLDRAQAGEKSLKPATWALLAPNAARNAKTLEDRTKIVDALLRIPVKEAAPELMPFFLSPIREFADPDDLLRNAVQVLVAMKARRELFRVVTEYGEMRDERRITNPNISRAAFEGLVELKAREEILTIARKDESSSAGEATEALAAMDDAEARAELLKLLASKNFVVRQHAALALGKKGVKEARPRLAEMLSDTEGPSLRAALDALSRLGVRDEVPRMVRLTHDNRSWVQVEAMRALVRLQAAEGIPAFQDLLTDKDPSVRAVAAESYGALKGKEAIGELLPMLRDLQPIVRLHAAAALCRAGSLKGVPVLIGLAEKGEGLHLLLNDQYSGGGVLAPLSLHCANAARSPDVWAKAAKSRVPEGSSGIVLEDAERFAVHLGLTLDLSPEVAQRAEALKTQRYYSIALPKEMEWNDLLYSFCLGSALEVVVDGKSLRLLTRAEAINEWKQWVLKGEPADDEDRAVAAAFREDLRRAALPPAERAALETREKDEARTLHRKERARAIEGALTPGLKARPKFEERLLDGDEKTWAVLALEIQANGDEVRKLAPADRASLVLRGQPVAEKPEDRIKILQLAHGLKHKDVDRMVLDLLRDADASVRVKSIYLLDPKEHAKEILGMAQDPAPWVRSAVAETLRESHPRESIELFKELSGNQDFQVSDRATMYLSFQPGPDLIPHMIGQLEKSKANFAAAHFALSYLGREGAREAIPRIVELLDEERLHCFPQAVQALQDLGAKESLPRILRTARRDWYPMRDSLTIFEAWNAREAIPEIHRMLNHKEKHGNGMLLKALARMGDRDALPEIRKLLREKWIGHRVEAVEALALLEGPEAKDAVLEIFKEPNTHPYDALVRSGAREAVPELKKQLTRFNPSLIETLIAFDAKDALPQILALMEKPVENQYVSDGLKAIARAWPKESIPTLRNHLASQNSGDGYVAAAMLCEAGSGDGVALLLEKKWPAFSLNALRRPEAWARLRDRRLDESLYGSMQELLERIGREAGLKVEGLPANAIQAKAWTGRHVFLRKEPAPVRLIELIDRLADARWAFILEDDTIRVVPKETAVAFWKQWWGSAPRK